MYSVLKAEINQGQVRMAKGLDSKISESRCFTKIDQAIRISRDSLFVQLAQDNSKIHEKIDTLEKLHLSREGLIGPECEYESLIDFCSVGIDKYIDQIESMSYEMDQYRE